MTYTHPFDGNWNCEQIIAAFFKCPFQCGLVFIDNTLCIAVVEELSHSQACVCVIPTINQVCVWNIHVLVCFLRLFRFIKRHPVGNFHDVSRVRFQVTKICNHHTFHQPKIIFCASKGK